MKTKELFKLKPQDTRYDMLYELLNYTIKTLNYATGIIKPEWDEIMEILETFLKDCQIARDLKVEECR